MPGRRQSRSTWLPPGPRHGPVLTHLPAMALPGGCWKDRARGQREVGWVTGRLRVVTGRSSRPGALVYLFTHGNFGASVGPGTELVSRRCPCVPHRPADHRLDGGTLALLRGPVPGGHRDSTIGVYQNLSFPPPEGSPREPHTEADTTLWTPGCRPGCTAPQHSPLKAPQAGGPEVSAQMSPPREAFQGPPTSRRVQTTTGTPRVKGQGCLALL